MSKQSVIETTMDAINRLLEDRAAAAEQLKTIADKVASLEGCKGNLDALKAEKLVLREKRENLLASVALGETKEDKNSLELISEAFADVQARMDAALEQHNINLLVVQGLERRAIDERTKLANCDRLLMDRVREYLQAKSDVAIKRYEAASDIVREVYPEIRGLGVWIAHLSNSRHPYLDDVNRSVGGANPVIPFGTPIEALAATGAYNVAQELRQLLPADAQLAFPVMH